MSPALRVNTCLKPATIDEAVALLRRKQPRAAVLAGGTWLVGEAPEGIEVAVDIGGLGLDAVRRVGNLLAVGATVTLQALVDGAGDLAATPMRDILGLTARAMAGLNIRNQATVGGAIVTSDASSPLVTALLACDAELVIHTDDRRTIALGAFLSYRERILAGGALIAEVRLPVPADDVSFAYERVARTPRDYPVVCAVARCAAKDGVVGSVRVAVGGAATTPVRLSSLELGLEKKRLVEHLDRELPPAIAALSPAGDWLGSVEYRREMASVLARRALLEAALRA